MAESPSSPPPATADREQSNSGTDETDGHLKDLGLQDPGKKFYSLLLAVLNIIIPVVTTVAELFALTDYTGTGEIDGLVAPQGVISGVMIFLFCVRCLVVAWQFFYNTTLIVEFQVGPKSNWHEKTTPRNCNHRTKTGQSEITISLPWQLFKVLWCKPWEHVKQEMFQQSELWINSEGFQFIYGLLNLAARVLQVFFLCRPRSVSQIVSATVSVITTIVAFVLTTEQRCSNLQKNGGFRSKREKRWNYRLYIGRALLLVSILALALWVVTDVDEGLPDIFIYVKPAAGTPLSFLCFKLKGTNATHNPLLLPDLPRAGGRAVCVVPSLQKNLCANYTSDDYINSVCDEMNLTSPVYITLQLRTSEHQVYFSSSLVIPTENSSQCIPSPGDYKLALVTHEKKEHFKPPDVLGPNQLADQEFTDSAKKHGHCTIRPLKHNADKVERSCVEEKERTCVKSKLSGLVPSSLHLDRPIC